MSKCPVHPLLLCIAYPLKMPANIILTNCLGRLWIRREFLLQMASHTVFVRLPVNLESERLYYNKTDSVSSLSRGTSPSAFPFAICRGSNMTLRNPNKVHTQTLMAVCGLFLFVTLVARMVADLSSCRRRSCG